MKLKTTTTVVLMIGMIFNVFSQVQNNNSTEKKGINIGNLVEMSGNWFIAYRDGVQQVQADANVTAVNPHSSAFVLKRSYFTLKKDIDKTFSVRYTMDLTIDEEGDDAGNVETRLKYLYLKAKLKSDFFTGTSIEAGMVHRPWLDYEQKINTYRVQDNMFIERNKIFNSADFGIMLQGNIGPKMDKDFLQNVNNSMKGKYASYAIGIYNGGGYSGAELNNNKVIAGRLSFRPFANSFPELQFSTYFNTGRGNSEYSPDFNQVIGFAGYTGKQITLTAQFHTGEGDFRALYVDENAPSVALDNHGYSFFIEYKLKKTPFAIWGRYDIFEVDQIDNDTERIIAGLTYKVNDYIRQVGNTEITTQSDEKENILELNLEIVF